MYKIENLKEFCSKIRKEYCWFLYNFVLGKNKEDTFERRLKFPFCCDLSANLISSYLKVNYDRNFKANKLVKVPYPHSWSANEECAIDYTFFQFDLSNEEKEAFLRHEISDKDKFEKIINRYPDVYYTKEEYDKLNCGFPFAEQSLYGEKYANNINNPENETEFFRYLNNATEDVSQYMIY